MPSRRASGGLGANWNGDTSQSDYRIQAKRRSRSAAAGPSGGEPGPRPGANQEAFLTLTKLGADGDPAGLLLKSKSPGASKASYIKVVIVPGGNVQVWTKAPKQSPYLKATFAATFAVNDQLGVRTQSDGSVTVFKNGILVGTTNVTGGTHPWAASLAGAGGRIGVIYAGTGDPPNDATFDDFGGGTLP